MKIINPFFLVNDIFVSTILVGIVHAVITGKKNILEKKNQKYSQDKDQLI